MKRTLLALGSISLMALYGCKTGYHRDYHSSSNEVEAVDCEQTLNNSTATDNAKRVYQLLTNLSCGKEGTKDGVLMGQNLGFGNQISTSYVEPSEGENGDDVLTDDERLLDRSYNRLVENQSNRPALISIGYEHDQTFTIEELREANTLLESHWQDDGIVMIHWMPLFSWGGSGASLSPNDNVDLAKLLEDGETRNAWIEKLDLVAQALDDLQSKGVPVLWRPLPAMNTRNQYWWGIDKTYDSSDKENASAYTKIWNDMYEYLTQTKQLNNLIWVYSPYEGEPLPGENSPTIPERTPAGWAYPGDDKVDVIGAIAEDDSLDIWDYKELSELGKPLGMAQLTPKASQNGGQKVSEPGLFNALTYDDRLSGSYENLCFWVSWHSYKGGGADSSNFFALADQNNYEGLADRERVLTRNDVELP